MTPLRILLDLEGTDGCGLCHDPISDDATEWISISKPCTDHDGVITSIFCSMSCWYRFCEDMIKRVAAVKESVHVEETTH